MNEEEEKAPNQRPLLERRRAAASSVHVCSPPLPPAPPAERRRKRLEQIWGEILNFPSSQKRLFQFVPAAQSGSFGSRRFLQELVGTSDLQLAVFRCVVAQTLPDVRQPLSRFQLAACG